MKRKKGSLGYSSLVCGRVHEGPISSSRTVHTPASSLLPLPWFTFLIGSSNHLVSIRVNIERQAISFFANGSLIWNPSSFTHCQESMKSQGFCPGTT